MTAPVLRQRERALSERFPDIAWLTPIPTTVADVTVLTCRLCTALHGLKGQDVVSGRVGFATDQEHAEHVAAEHMEPGEAGPWWENGPVKR